MCKIEDKHLQLYPHRPNLTIKSQALHYVDGVKGLGPTHVKAYCEGAKFLAKLIISGHVSLEELQNV